MPNSFSSVTTSSSASDGIEVQAAADQRLVIRNILRTDVIEFQRVDDQPLQAGQKRLSVKGLVFDRQGHGLGKGIDGAGR